MSSDGSRILLVEDNPAEEELTLMALAEANVNGGVEVARDGAAALDRLLDVERPLPEFVLLDLRLPKIGGLELVRRVRGHERTRLVPLIILTNSREENDLVAAYTNGANSYLRKPVNFDQFTRTMRQICSYWLELNERPPAGPQLTA
jgi:DNA-binding response OmpR family regulator